MTPFNISFRKLLRKYIPQIDNEQLDKHESLFAARTQLMNDIKIIDERKWQNYLSQLKQHPITSISNESEEIFQNYSKQYNAVHELWLARRQFALEQGKYLQIPTSFTALYRYVETGFKYHLVQIKTLPILWINQLKYFLRNVGSGGFLVLAVVVALILLGLGALNLKNDRDREWPKPDQEQIWEGDSLKILPVPETDNSTNIQP